MLCALVDAFCEHTEYCAWRQCHELTRPVRLCIVFHMESIGQFMTVCSAWVVANDRKPYRENLSLSLVPHLSRPTDVEFIIHELLSVQLADVSGTIIDLLARAQELYEGIGARRMMYQVRSPKGAEACLECTSGGAITMGP